MIVLYSNELFVDIHWGRGNTVSVLNDFSARAVVVVVVYHVTIVAIGHGL